MKRSFSPISRQSQLPSPRGFTLIELLIVIAIIGILMSLMFPAVNSALNSARRASAQNDVTQIANAITMYQTEYGRMPPESDTVSGDLLSALMGVSEDDNRRRIVFLEVQDAKRNRSGITNDTFVDPWGGSYQVAMDTDYNNTVDLGSAQNRVDPGTSTLRRTVAVWNTNENARLRVGSW
jgi:type II secretion system protein G